VQPNKTVLLIRSILRGGRLALLPPYHADGITLHHGDCRDILAHNLLFSLDDPVGLLILDPPSAPTRAGNPSRTPGGDQGPEGMWRTLTATRQTIALAIPLLAWDAHVLVFASLTTWPAVCSLLSPFVPVQELLVWQQQATHGGRARSRPADSRTVIVHASTTSPRHAALDVALPTIAPVTTPVRWNPAEKPLDLLAHVIERYCPPDGLVLDPFARSGSTLVAAQRLRRRAVGVERDLSRFAFVAQRLHTTRSRTRRAGTPASQGS
jgi:site-specific DNA-methyltransferase (adenine-specific)